MADEARDAARNAKTATLREEYESLVRAWELLIWEMESIEANRLRDDAPADGADAKHASER